MAACVDGFDGASDSRKSHRNRPSSHSSSKRKSKQVPPVRPSDSGTSLSSRHVLPELTTFESDVMDTTVRLHAAALYGKDHRKPEQAFIADHPVFRLIVNGTVIISAIQMGVAADVTTSDWQAVWIACDHVFTAVFALELFIMISALRCFYFKSPWLVFDGFVAVFSMFDTWFLPLAGLSGNFGFLRQFRLLRLLRIAKVAHFIPELSVVVEGLINSLRSMFWISLLLIIMIYASAILCVHVLGRPDSGFPGYKDDQQTINLQAFAEWNNYSYFGTVYRAMLTLFGMVLLSEWPVVRHIMEVSFIMVPFFGVLVILVAYGVLNVIIGIVVEKTTEAMDKLKAQKDDALQQRRADTAIHLAELLFRHDADGDNHLGLEELRAAADDEDLTSIFIKLNLPENYTTTELLRMLDTNGSGKLSRTEFVNGILRLIYSTDFQRQCVLNASIGVLHHEMKRIHVEMRKEIHVLFDNVAHEMRSLRSANAPEPMEAHERVRIGSCEDSPVSEPPGEIVISCPPTVSVPSSEVNVSVTSFFSNDCGTVNFEVNAPDASPETPHPSCNLVQDQGFVVTSGHHTPPVSSIGEPAGGDVPVSTCRASWERLKTAPVAPARVYQATGHMIHDSITDTAKFKDQHLLGNPVLSSGRSWHVCPGQETGEVPSLRPSNKDGPSSANRLIII